MTDHTEELIRIVAVVALLSWFAHGQAWWAGALVSLYSFVALRGISGSRMQGDSET